MRTQLTLPWMVESRAHRNVGLMIRSQFVLHRAWCERIFSFWRTRRASHHPWFLKTRAPCFVAVLSSGNPLANPTPGAAVGSLDDGPQLHNTALTLCRCPYAQHDGIPRHLLCNLHHVVFQRASFWASETQTSMLTSPS